MKPQCAVPGCTKTAHSRDLCGSHYQRQRVTGDVRADIPLGVGQQLAWLQKNCQPHHDNCVVWPFNIGPRGYGTVSKDGKPIGAHAESCRVANGPKPTPGHEAAHICGNKACINGKHLRWATRKENAADRIIHGTHKEGETAAHAKLTNEQARAIMAEKGRQRDIAARYGVTQKVVSLIKQGKTYRSALGMS